MRHQVQDRDGNELAVEPIALVPRPQFLLVGSGGVGRGPRDARAEEPLEVLGLPFGDILFVDGGLVIAEEVESVLGQWESWIESKRTNLAWEMESPSRLTSKRCAGSRCFLVLGSMGRLTRSYSAWWTASAKSNLSRRCFFSLHPVAVRLRLYGHDQGHLLSCLGAQVCRTTNILRAQDELVPAIDGLTLVPPGSESGGFQPANRAVLARRSGDQSSWHGRTSSCNEDSMIAVNSAYSRESPI